MLKNFQYGGQAVIEGVMMRGPKEVAVAVRKPQGEVIVDRQVLNSVTEKYPVLKRPMLRGVVALFEALVLGIRMLTFSANTVMEEEEEELSSLEIALTVSFALAMAVLLFVIIPTVAVHFIQPYFSFFWQNLIEGVLRILIFLGYVVGISFLKDIQRVFQYHGAEHKVIHAYEADEKITSIKDVQKYTTLHPRCGTAFLLMVMVLTVLFFSFLETPDLFLRITSRILLLPVVAGAAYELIKFSARHSDKKLVSAITMPGLWLQKLTTREPDDSQVEVALTALNAVLPDEEKMNEKEAGGAVENEQDSRNKTE